MSQERCKKYFLCRLYPAKVRVHLTCVCGNFYVLAGNLRARVGKAEMRIGDGDMPNTFLLIISVIWAKLCLCLVTCKVSVGRKQTRFVCRSRPSTALSDIPAFSPILPGVARNYVSSLIASLAFCDASTFKSYLTTTASSTPLSF